MKIVFRFNTEFPINRFLMQFLYKYNTKTYNTV